MNKATYIGVDVGTDDTCTECIVRDNGDGTITVLAFNEWKHDIELHANEQNRTRGGDAR